MMMADHGAEVIEVEPYDGGEPGRHIGLAEDGETVFFRNTHRGKRSLRLNLKHPVAARSSFVSPRTPTCWSSRSGPGSSTGSASGTRRCPRRAPQLVYCSISAFGQTGRYRDRPAHDLAVESMAGLVSVNLGPDDRPAMPGVPAADMAGSLMALAGILMALLRRRATGRGRLSRYRHARRAAGLDGQRHGSRVRREPSTRSPSRSGPGAATPSTTSTRRATASGSLWGPPSRSSPRPFLAKSGRSDLAPYAHRPPGEQGPLIAYLRALFRERTLADWLAWLDGMDVGYAPVRSLADAIDDPNTRERRMVMVDDRGRRHLGVPIRFAREPAQPLLRTPTFGEHTDEVVASLGYDKAEIERLRSEGVIG